VAPAGGPAEDVLGDLLAPTVEAALEQAGERDARRSSIWRPNDTHFAELLTRVPRSRVKCTVALPFTRASWKTPTRYLLPSFPRTKTNSSAGGASTSPSARAIPTHSPTTSPPGP